MSFCEHCIDLKELPGSPQGSDETIGGVNTYVARGTKTGTLVIATDIFGNGIPNPKLIADNLSKQSGYSVYVPDIFPGGPIKPDDFILPKKASDGPPKDDVMGKNFENFGGWLGKGNSPEKTFPIYKAVIQAAAKNGPVGAIGYCYGCKLAFLASKETLVKGISLYHPALLEPQEAKEVNTPILLNQAELDPRESSLKTDFEPNTDADSYCSVFAGELKETWEKTLEGSKLDSRSKVYPNTVHGFGCRPDVNDPKVKAGWEESLGNVSKFFQEVLG